MITRRHPVRRAIALVGIAVLLGACSAGGGQGEEASKATTTTGPSTTEAPESTTTEAPDTPSTTISEDALAAWEEAFGTALASSEVAGAEDPGAEGPTDETADDCAGRLWLDIITIEALEDAGYGPDDLDDIDITTVLPDLIDYDQALQLLDASIECGLDPLGGVVEGMVESGLTEDQAWCIVDTAPMGTFEEAVALVLDQGEEALETNAEYEAIVAAAAEECLAGG